MQIQTQSNELIIRIPKDLVDIAYIQDFLNYIRFKTIVAKSQATEADIEEIANEINQSWLDQQSKSNKNEENNIG